MEKTKDINKLIDDIEKIANVEKCLTCQCFADTLQEFGEVLKKQEVSAETKERLARIAAQAKVTHNCLGCDPCYPVPLSNVLSEMTGTPAGTCTPMRKPAPMKLMRLTPSWPVEQGEYIVGRKTAPIAISTLGSDELPSALATTLGKEGLSIVGRTHTENIGIEKIIKNTVTNPDIRFLILCGKDPRGHMPGQSLISLVTHGVNHEKRIINTKGQRPFLKNLEFSEIEHFRSQIEIINLIETEDPSQIQAKVVACVERNPGRFDKTLTLKKIDKIEAHPPGRLVLDPSGFFIIYPQKEEGRIYLEHYKADGALNEIIFGEDPVLIASTAVERNLVSRLVISAGNLKKRTSPCAMGFSTFRIVRRARDKFEFTIPPGFFIIWSMRLTSVLLFLIAFSLVIQNTCPYGFAGKTAFAAPFTHDCPLKKGHHSPSNGKTSVDEHMGKVFHSSFVVSTPDVQAFNHHLHTNVNFSPLPSDKYRNPFKKPSIRPPAA